jgi:UDP-N-acetylmuramyl pentapeptide phosphotransferase/UDP-N-acetylglucosamine-1-phosphate transferase
LVRDPKPPALWNKRFLLFNPPSLYYFVMATLAVMYRYQVLERNKKWKSTWCWRVHPHTLNKIKILILNKF